jgi:Protein of unknown function (DUF3179)
MTDELRGVTRRRFLQAVGGLGLAGGVSFLVARGIAYRPEAPEAGRAGRLVAAPGARTASEAGTDSLDELARNIRNGGPGKDGIPAIDHPRFVTAAEAGFLADQDVVFGLVRDGQTRAYPQLVLVWHEIVNDHFPSGPLSVTYCPLTGSAVAFHGSAPGGRPYTFGTSGDLVNSNLLMYDRQTDSRWPQLLGQAILGPARGQVLEQVPLDWTSWGRWRSAHPDTVVLSTRTGFLRQYGNDPYGSYNYGASHELFGYYKPGQGRFLYFPLLHESGHFDEKEVMVGAQLGPHRLAVRKALLRRRGTVRAMMGGRPVVFRHDPALDVGRAYLLTGGGSLRRLVSLEVMWLAWYAFFPGAPVIG